MSVTDDWAAYMTACGASTTTVAVRVRTINALIKYAGVQDVTQLTRVHVIGFLSRDLAAWSRVTYWRGIKQFALYLTEFDCGPDNLLQGIPKPRVPDPVARPITDDVVKRLLAAKLSPRAHGYVRLALFAGLRVHEIARVRGEDFDHQAGWLFVTGKGGRTAPVPLHPEVRQLAESMPEFGWWFTSPVDMSKPVGAAAVSHTITAALRSVGCTATPHQLRDTAATKMQRQVKNIRLTQQMMRHRNLATTMKYTGVADDAMQEAVLSLAWPA